MEAHALTGAPASLPRRSSSTVWLAALVGYAVWLAVLAITLLVVACLHMGAIKLHLLGEARTYVLPACVANLDARHTASERLAFSNTVVQLFDCMESHALTDPTNQWMGSAFQQLAMAMNDRVILPDESAAFCTSVWRRLPPRTKP